MKYKRLEDITDIASLSKEERMMYDEAIKVYRDNLVTEEYAYNRGFAIGFTETFVESFAESCAKGCPECSLESCMRMRYSLVHALKESGISAGAIAEATNLAIEEINKIWKMPFCPAFSDFVSDRDTAGR